MTSNAVPSCTEIIEASRLIARMLPYFSAGMSFEDAGRAVLQRDQELADMSLADDERGAAMRKALAERVYADARRQSERENSESLAADLARQEIVRTLRDELDGE